MSEAVVKKEENALLTRDIDEAEDAGHRTFVIKNQHPQSETQIEGVKNGDFYDPSLGIGYGNTLYFSVLQTKKTRSYFEQGAKKPTCLSFDGVTGNRYDADGGKETIACATCPLKEWVKQKDGKSRKACKDPVTAVILIKGENVPKIIRFSGMLWKAGKALLKERSIAKDRERLVPGALPAKLVMYKAVATFVKCDLGSGTDIAISAVPGMSADPKVVVDILTKFNERTIADDVDGTVASEL